MRTAILTIGELSRRTSLTPRAIRYYERLGLVAAPRRSEANYRLFDSDSVERLRFIAKCRSLGFSITEIADLVAAMDDADHTCAQVAELARHHLGIVDAKLQSLVDVRRTLGDILAHCTHRKVPDCAVLDFLSRRD